MSTSVASRQSAPSATVPRRTALVTGGTTGLGNAIARRLHDAGHTVLVTYHAGGKNPDKWLAAEAEQGYTFRAYPIDIADYESCLAVAERIAADNLQVDILVNNAGVTRDRTVRKLDKGGGDDVVGAQLCAMID